MAQTDKPSLHPGSLADTSVYTGSDAPDTTGDTASPPMGSLYVRRDPTGAGPQGEVGIYQYVPLYTPAPPKGSNFENPPVPEARSCTFPRGSTS